jgi:hypothetical protein
MAQEQCELNFRIAASGLLAGYGKNSGSFEVNGTNREFVFKAWRGMHVRGTVVAADTGKPITGADVGPIIFCPPLFVTDRERLVKTDANGRFELTGVDRRLGIGAAHLAYVENTVGFNLQDEATTNSDGSISVVLKLERGKKVDGVVKDDRGKLLGGVEVETGDGKKTLTDSRGEFHFEGIEPRREFMLILKKDGFVEKWIYESKVKRGNLKITMERQSELKGRVVGPDGQIVTNFTAWAGPGQEPSFSCNETNAHPDGTFRLLIQERSKTNWIGIRAPECAPWFGNVMLSDLKKEIVFHLEPGVDVNLSLVLAAEKRAGLRGQLQLIRMTPKEMVNPDDPSQQQSIATCEALLDAAGAMHFHHVAAGRYLLTLRGPAVSPLSMKVVVAKTSVGLGVLKLRGTGTIVGQIFSPEKSQVKPAYARGEIYFQIGGEAESNREMIPFTADANGKFRVENVPVGNVSVHLPFMATADIRDAVVREASVVEDKTTEVKFFEP